MKIYEVGGSVRDKILGIKSKDTDFVAVSEYPDIARAWDEMLCYVIDNTKKRFQVVPEMFTIRALHKTLGPVDFVLARKEKYTENSRRPIVMPGSLKDDLLRRDFTCNAVAISEDGSIIDPLGGVHDINIRLLRTPLCPEITLRDDPLRALRAVRFCVTREFVMQSDIENAMLGKWLLEVSREKLSRERIYEELKQCFQFDTWRTLKLLNGLNHDLVKYWLAEDGWYLIPTNKEKKWQST